MKTPSNNHYHQIEIAINHVRENFPSPLNLKELSQKMNLSSEGFLQVFTEWAGTSPETFFEYISRAQAKKNRKEEEQATLFHTGFGTGSSGADRSHKSFIHMEKMTPAEYKNGGKDLPIYYRFAESLFGTLMIASTGKGICFLAFEDNKEKAWSDLKSKFPNAFFQQKSDSFQQSALLLFQDSRDQSEDIKLHLKGTDFQWKVWECLLRIPSGKLSTYGSIAREIGNPNASRAVGTAIGSNPVAYLIPCHRVVQSSGNFGGYMWGPTRKAAMIGWERAKMNV